MYSVFVKINRFLLNRILPFDNTNEKEDNRKDEQDMDKSTKHMKANKSYEP